MRARFSLLTMLMMLLIGCAHASNAPSGASTTAPMLIVPPLGTRTNPTGDSATIHFNEHSPAPSGCFGLSRRTGAVACIIGAYSLISEKGDRKLTILSSGDEGQEADREIEVIATDGVLKLDAESLKLVEKTMREGDYMKLGASAIVPSGTNQAIAGMMIGLTTSQSRSEEDDQQQGMPLPPPRKRAARRETDLRVSVILIPETNEPEADADSVLLHNTVSDISCVSANLNVRVLESSIVLIERECHQSDSDIVIGAWLCDSDKKRCD